LALSISRPASAFRQGLFAIFRMNENLLLSFAAVAQRNGGHCRARRSTAAAFLVTDA
jgi:hypothetical protein